MLDNIENGESISRLESNKYNQGTKNAQLIHEILNSATNWNVIIDKINSGKARDINDEIKVIDNKNCFIIGSGPSLDDSIEYLKEWKGGIICTTSHALSLIYHGIEPTHILVLDPFCQWSEIEGIDWSKTRTKLIAHPGCRPDLIKNWPNDILLYIQNAGRTDSFYQNEQQKMYSWRDGDFRLSTFHFYIHTAITIFACSPPMQLFVGEQLGYDKFFLAGCDFAFHSNKERFTDYTVKDYYNIANIEWEKHEHPFNPNNTNLVKTNNGLLSEPGHLYYLKNMISAWRLCHKTVYTTDHGAMTQVPYHDIKAVIKKQGDFPIQSRYFIDSVCDKYLATTGAFVIETSKGTSFVESANPIVELRDFMNQVMLKYTCDSCGANLTANPLIYKLFHDDTSDEFNNPDLLLKKYLEIHNKSTARIEVYNVSSIDHTSEECPICKKGKIHKDINIDVEANMKRIINSMPKEKK